MLKQAMEFLMEKARPELVEVGERKYSTNDLYPVLLPQVEGFKVSSLSSIIQYLKDNPDDVGIRKIIAIESPERALLKTQAYGEFEQRDTLIQADAFIPRIRFGEWMGKENFIIQLQSAFTKFEDKTKEGEIVLSEGDKDILLKCIGNLKSEVVKNHGDDGVSQKVEIKQGIATVAEAVVPNPVTLAPYRTFPEIIQVPSNFIFRMREGRDGIEMALFEADGGAWRIEAMKRIRDWFKVQIENELDEEEAKRITILA